MFVIGEVVVDDEVAQTSFCCDLSACKGACCCIEGGRGAPLEDEEVGAIEKVLPVVWHYLSPASRRVIETAGPVEGSPGNFATTCIGNRECVFVYFEDGIARCTFEKAYERGETGWRKPLSCHLFPVRVRSWGRDSVHYEVIDECLGGRVRGREQQIPLHGFLREPLVRKYGEEWYAQFQKQCVVMGGAAQQKDQE